MLTFVLSPGSWKHVFIQDHPVDPDENASCSASEAPPPCLQKKKQRQSFKLCDVIPLVGFFTNVDNTIDEEQRIREVVGTKLSSSLARTLIETHLSLNHDQARHFFRHHHFSFSELRLVSENELTGLAEWFERAANPHCATAFLESYCAGLQRTNLVVRASETRRVFLQTPSENHIAAVSEKQVTQLDIQTAILTSSCIRIPCDAVVRNSCICLEDDDDNNDTAEEDDFGLVCLFGGNEKE